MRRYWKGSDLRLDIQITDREGQLVPLSSIDSLVIYLTTSGEQYVEYSYPKDIMEDADGIYIPINENALSYLPDGLLKWEAHFKIRDAEWDNGRDTVRSCETDIFVKTPREFVPKQNVQEKEISLTENGDYEIIPDAGYEGISRMVIKVEFDAEPFYQEGFMKFLRREATGKLELPIECMDTPYCLYKQKGVTEVVVPEGTTSIPDNFFQMCTLLGKISYPITVIQFGSDIYGNIDYDKIMSFPIPQYLNRTDAGNIYYNNGEVFNYPKYINLISGLDSGGDILPYNNGIAKRINFQGHLHEFYFGSFRAEEVDFSHNVRVPSFRYTSIYTGLTKVIVPESLYDTWITTSPWSDYASITEAVPDINYYIPYRTRSGNDISLTTGVKGNRYAVISSNDKKVCLRGTPWDCDNLFNKSSDVTFVDYAAAGLEIPSFASMFYELLFLTGCTVPQNKPLSVKSMFYRCTSLITAPEMDTRNVCGKDGEYMFYSCGDVETIPEYDFRNFSSTNYCFDFCTSLTNVGGFVGLKVSTDLHWSSLLTHDSLMNIITKASDVNKNPQTLTFGATNLAKLSDEEKAIATSKGWTLA